MSGTTASALQALCKELQAEVRELQELLRTGSAWVASQEDPRIAELERENTELRDWIERARPLLQRLHDIWVLAELDLDYESSDFHKLLALKNQAPDFNSAGEVKADE